MSKVSDLLPADRDAVDRIIHEIANGNWDGAVESRLVSRRIASELIRLDEAGERWARRAMHALIADGIRSRVTTLLKEEYGTIRIAKTGRVLSIPRRFGFRPRAADGTRQKHSQLRLWETMSWDEFEELLQALASQAGVLHERLTGLREIMKLRDLYPASQTPGEACEMAGIDPSAFDMDMPDTSAA